MSVATGRPWAVPVLRAVPARVRRGGIAASVAAGAALVLSLIVLAALFGPPLLAQDPFAQDLLARNAAPDGAHWLGTDHLGRDVLARLLIGARLSLAVGIAAMLTALLLGGGLGLLAAALGGVADTLFFGFVDLVRTMPGILLALVLLVALGSGLAPLILALGITFAPFFARVARATYQREAASDYVAASRAFGCGALRILRRHILPNVAGAFVTLGAIILPRCIVTESVLSFLGLGSAPDTPTWGRMIAQAARYVELAPHAVAAPVTVLSLLTLSLAILGDRLRVRVDPRRRAPRRRP